MTTTINASTSNGLVQSADGSGIIKLQSNGVTTNALAWVNFNGTGTVAIRSSYNVSSITDNGTGIYTVNFATALSDANYAVNVTCGGNIKRAQVGSIGQSTQSGYTYSASAVSVQNSDPSNTGSPLADVEIVNVAVFGN